MEIYGLLAGQNSGGLPEKWTEIYLIWRTPHYCFTDIILNDYTNMSPTITLYHDCNNATQSINGKIHLDQNVIQIESAKQNGEDNTNNGSVYIFL